ncbi:hypothetical protein ACLOJK_004808 [Asimina triloba]
MLSTDQFRDDVPNYFITDDDETDGLEDSLFDLFDNDDFVDIGDIGADFDFDMGLWVTMMEATISAEIVKEVPLEIFLLLLRLIFPKKWIPV